MKTVVLTFDDGFKSHFEFVQPILREHNFNATFFVNVGGKGFMTWEEIKELSNSGFEIGNHFRFHAIITEKSEQEIKEDFLWMENSFEQNGLPKPISLCYPGFYRNISIMNLAREFNYQFARGGCDKTTPFYEYQEGGFGTGYDYIWDNPFNIDCLGIFGNKFGFHEFVLSLQRIKENQCGIFCFHNFNHNSVISIPAEDFLACIDHLERNDYKVISLAEIPKEYNFEIGKKEVEIYYKLRS